MNNIKNMIINNFNNKNELSKLIDEYLIPQELEKKQNAEISTPYKLRQDMLNSIDKYVPDFWKEKRKIFEPCCGKGGFLIDIIDRFLKTGIEYKTIVEECLYFSDINPTNIFICKLLLDPYNEYKLNYNEGDTLKLNIKEKWKLEGFDAVIGNPPYNKSQKADGKRGGGDLLWNKFIIKSLNEWILDKKYLVFVHPAGWRKPEGGKTKYKNLFEIMTKENQMIYLEIHNTKDGMKMFRCGTRYDWYLIKKNNENKETIIKDELNKINKENLKMWNFLPNYNFENIKKLIANENDEKCKIIYDVNKYETRKKYISLKQDEKYKYPLIHSTPKNGIRYMYSSRNDLGHFGISKVIFGESGINEVVIDKEGKYGMTQEAIGIETNNLNEYKKFLESEFFLEIIKSCMWSNYQIDWRLFKYFKKDFWKEII